MPSQEYIKRQSRKEGAESAQIILFGKKSRT